MKLSPATPADSTTLLSHGEWRLGNAHPCQARLGRTTLAGGRVRRPILFAHFATALTISVPRRTGHFGLPRHPPSLIASPAHENYADPISSIRGDATEATRRFPAGMRDAKPLVECVARKGGKSRQ